MAQKTKKLAKSREMSIGQFFAKKRAKRKAFDASNSQNTAENN